MSSKEIIESENIDAMAPAIGVLKARRKARPTGPKLKLDLDEDGRTLNVGFDTDNEVLAHAKAMLEVGVVDDRVFSGLLTQIAALGKQGSVASEEASNFVLGVIGAIDPQDTVEAMLATQMAATHQPTMMLARRLNHVETIQQQDAAERAFNKLARTFTKQMEALKRYRATAQHTVRVERVTVNDGGQAIVGPAQHGGRIREEM